MVRRALGELVDGEHFFDIMTDDVAYEVRYDLGWSRLIASLQHWLGSNRRWTKVQWQVSVRRGSKVAEALSANRQ